jgi:fermentation-respiration switch protein FrsA (DUF1100 family)
MTSLVLIPIFVYVGLMIIALLVADRVIFQPQQSFYQNDASVLKLNTVTGEKISARYYPNPQAAYTILFSHGNAEDLGTNDSFLKELRDDGFAVFAYDYRGYGTSDGSPSEANSYADADLAYEYVTNELNIPSERLILHGRSLGAAVSIDLASRQNAGGLIVESGFTSAFRVLTKVKVMPFDKFDSIKKIPAISCPILFIHGKVDRLIPFHHAESLFAAATAPKYFLWIDAAGHNDVAAKDRSAYFGAIREFAANLPK